MRLHTNKPGIRTLGVAESFRVTQKSSVLSGVVMRSDLVIDGIAFGKTSVGGDDATRSIISLYKKFRRNDINLLMVSGAILSFYNIIDVDRLSSKTGVPVVCVTYKKTAGIEDSIRRRFPNSESKLIAYRRLGKRLGITLRTRKKVYVRASGIDPEATKQVLDLFTLQGAIPEPVRVAKLMARAGLAGRS